MPSEFEDMAAEAADELAQVFADREPVFLLLGQRELQVPAVLSRERFQTTYDGQGGEVRVVTRTADVETRRLLEANVTALPSRFHVRIGDVTWPADMAATIWGEAFVTIGLRMDQLARLKTGERRGTV